MQHYLHRPFFADQSRIFTHFCSHMRGYMCMHTNVYIYISIYIYIYIYLHANKYIYVCIYLDVRAPAAERDRSVGGALQLQQLNLHAAVLTPQPNASVVQTPERHNPTPKHIYMCIYRCVYIYIYICIRIYYYRYIHFCSRLLSTSLCGGLQVQLHIHFKGTQTHINIFICI